MPEAVALGELPPNVAEFLAALERKPQFRVEHGSYESLICYRGFGLAGVDRHAGHLFVSETVVTYETGRWLLRLGFTHQKMPRPPDAAYGSHTWYQIPMAELGTFDHAVREFAKLIDDEFSRRA